jgi:hypothetical protein
MLFYDPLEDSLRHKNQPPFSVLNEYNISYKIIYSPKMLRQEKFDNLHLIWPSFYVENVEDFWNTYANKILDIKKIVKENSVKFYFNAYDSGVPPTNQLEQILRIIQIIGVNPKDITIITGNSYDKFILEQMLLGKGVIGITFNIGDREIVNACLDYIQYLTKGYKKRFIFLCRRLTPWRTLIFFDLLRRGILEENYSNKQADGFYTWSKYNPYAMTEESTEQVIYMTKRLLEKTDNRKFSKMMINWISKNAKRICDNSPYIIHEERNETKEMTDLYPQDVQERYPAVYQWTRKSLANTINSSALSLTVETHYGDESPEVLHLTEKTIRTMFFKLPFIQYSNPTFLAKLKAMGFQTFDNFWDESYDNEFDPFERMIKINDQVQVLHRMRRFDFHDLIAQTSDITNHNYKKMWEMTRNYISDSEQKIKLGGLVWNKINSVKS